MMRPTPPALKLVSTHTGQRRILKTRLPVPRYIELAVKAGSYKTPSTRPHYLGLQDTRHLDRTSLSPREREERLKMRRGVMDYPPELEILAMNPPLPDPPRTPVHIRKKIANERKRQRERAKKAGRKAGLDGDEPELPKMDDLVRSYLGRREASYRRSNDEPARGRQDEEYYNKLLLDRARDADDDVKTRFLSPSSLTTAMGRKAVMVENAYAFALRQQEEMIAAGRRGTVLTEEESRARVEEILGREASENRREGHDAAKGLKEWRSGDGDKYDDGTAPPPTATVLDKDEPTSTAALPLPRLDEKTLPSIFHGRPRTVRALAIWSGRLRSVPYSRWTIGASTALDHWVAREVLQMDEATWQTVLDGGGTDAYAAYEAGGRLPSGETRAGLIGRMRDVVAARTALFPETLHEDRSALSLSSELAGDLDVDDDDRLSSRDSVEKSIDELLKGLGSDGDDDESFSFDDFRDDDEKGEGGAGEEDGETAEAGAAEIGVVLDELQVWRERHATSPHESWDRDEREQFDQFVERYVAAVSPESDGSSVDKEATRAALLSERPNDVARTKEFWDKIQTETEAESFLQDYRSRAEARLAELDGGAADDEGLRDELEAVLSVPYDRQLAKLTATGALRPILDEYVPSDERRDFLSRHSAVLLEGLELEHLVPDPDGPVGVDDLGPELREVLAAEWTPGDGGGGDGASPSSSSAGEPRFRIEMIAYGSDLYGTDRAAAARRMYRLWNEHRSSRARFEESFFRKGYLGLEEDGKKRTAVDYDSDDD